MTDRCENPLRTMFVRVVAIASAGLIVFVSAACNGKSPESSADANAGADQMIHIHGLGINPADGVLYVATHFGLFRLAGEGKSVKVASRTQDMMGFAVAGPNHFLASGHPGVEQMNAEKLPPLLGLLDSRDAGETWQKVSLLGQADFHALRFAHSQIYGFNSSNSAFMVSRDGIAWETRSKVALYDFAVSPADPGVIVASTPEGPAQSRDGGATWTPAPGAQVALLGWRPDGRLFGAAPDGSFHSSSDQGATWEKTGKIPAPPAALLAAESGIYAATQDAGIYKSDDAGSTWQLLYQDTK